AGGTEFCGQQHQHRPEPFTSGVKQMSGRFGDKRLGTMNGFVQRRFDVFESLADAFGQIVVGKLDVCHFTLPTLRRHQRTKAPACWAKSSTGPGMIPNANVAMTVSAITVVVSGLAIATLGPEPTGSVKNISTITRM